MQKILSAIICTTIFSSASFAGSIASIEKTESGVYWTPNSQVTSVTLTIVGPNGFYLQKNCDSTDISITEFPEDGLYKYEITSNKARLRRVRSERDYAATTRSDKNRGLKQSGHFRVVDAQPLIDTEIKEK